MTRLKIAAALAMVALVVAGHVGLWMSDEWTRAAKLRLTVLNALGWGVVILPAFAVAAWARAHRDDRS